jgi:hypothetical protein
MTDQTPLDADQLMNFAERIERLPADDAEWVKVLFSECLRARLHEAELRAGAADPLDSGAAGRRGKEVEAQFAQVALDAAEWLKTLWNVGYMGAGSFPAPPRTAFPKVELDDVLKSALFARIRAGKRPLPFPPPTRLGLPWHDLIDSREKTYAVAAEIVRDGEGAAVGAVIEACAHWQIVEEIVSDHEYIVQHRGKGPLFRLQLDALNATLHREAPRWTRRIRRHDRGGVRSYTLEWPQDDGRLQSIALRAATWERAESEAGYWIATKYPAMYGQVSFERVV